MRQQLEDMLQRQNQFQVEHIAADWIERGLDWKRAVWTEASELLGHLGWKWWAQDECDLWQAQLEAADIACFLFSWVLEEAGGNIPLAVKRLEHGLEKPAYVNPDRHRVAERFAASILSFERPCLPQFRALLDALELDIQGLYARYIGKMVLNRFRQDNGYKLGTYQKTWGGKEDNAHLQAVVEDLPIYSIREEKLADLGQVIYAGLDSRYRKLVKDAPVDVDSLGRHSDDYAVDRFATAMKLKLSAARRAGRGGWDDPDQCAAENLLECLRGNLDKSNPGNWVDIASFCMMLHERGLAPVPVVEADNAAREPSAAELDMYLDSVLIASGSSLKNYTLPGTLEKMRFMMRNAMLAMVTRSNGKAEAA